MNWMAAKGFLIAQPIKVNEQTESGLFLPGTSTSNPNTGRVISVGKDSQYAFGDIILYKWMNAIDDPNLPEGQVIVDETHILAFKRE